MKVFFRADGNEKTGLGHVYRCLALAEILSDYELVFIIRDPYEAISSLIKQYCSQVIQLKSEQGYEEEAKSLASILTSKDIIILDGYNFVTSYQEILKSSGVRIICIDDICSYHFVADVVINHAGGLQAGLYSIEDYTKLYLGPSYAIVRSEFWNRPAAIDRTDDEVLVCLGGADPNNDLLYVLQQVFKVAGKLHYNIVTGSAYAHDDALDKFLATAEKSVQRYRNLGAIDMKTVMQRCARAICSPSTVSYEYLSIGGELYLHTIADNQERIYHYFTSEGLAMPLKEFLMNDAKRITAMLEKQHEVFDGKSYERIRTAILQG